MNYLPFFQYTLNITAVVLSLVSIVYFWRKGNKTPLLYSLLICIGLAFIWTLAYTLEIMFGDTPEKRWMFIRLEYIAIPFTGMAWIVFCLIFVGYMNVVTKRNILFLLILPTVFFILVQTNGYHHLVFSYISVLDLIRTPTFMVFFGTIIVEFMIGMVILAVYAANQKGLMRKQALLLIVCPLMPVLLAFLTVSKIFYPEFDPAPSSNLISLSLFGIATFKYRFLNIVPMALKEVFGNIKISIVVIDINNSIVDYNNSFERTFKKLTDLKKNQDVSVLTESIKKYTRNRRMFETLENAIQQGTKMHVYGEIELESPVNRCFFTSVEPILDKRWSIMGRVVLFNDITDFKKLQVDLTNKNIELQYANEELTDLNKQLEIYAATAEDLAIARERTRFARDAHDTLGHTMALLVALLETGVGEIDSSNKTARERVLEALQLAKEGLNGLRQSVSGLAFKEVKPDRLVHMLETLSTDFEATGKHIDLSIDGVLTCSDPRYSEVVYRICREALTNSARHGKASSITVVLRFHNDAIKLFIIDDGIGCKKIKKGLGLSGMEHAVAELGGELHYGSDGEKGFSINVEIPVSPNGNGLLAKV